MNDSAGELVGRLVAAGEWPEPQLLEAILAQGEAAVEPLCEVVRREVHGWPEEAPLCHAVDLLGSLRAVAAIPDLIELFSCYDNETLHSVSTTLGQFGDSAVEPLLAVVRNPARSWYQRSEATQAAVMAAHKSPELLERVASTLRELLSGHVTRAAELSEEEKETATFIVCDLSSLADPKARDLIDAAFNAKLVDGDIISQESVETDYARGPADVTPPEPRDWLEEYKEIYQEELDYPHRDAEHQTEEDEEFSDEDEEFFEDEEENSGKDGEPWQESKQRPIEHEGPRLGRNDPCWCGSGKKFKNCHLKVEPQ